MNTNHRIHKFRHDKALKEAKDWLLKMKLEPTTTEIHSEFQEWLAADPVHQSKFDQLKAIWEGVDFLKTHPLTLAELEETEIPWHGSKIGIWFNRLVIRPPLFRAVVVLTTILLIVTGIWLTQTGVDTTRSYHTGTGEQKVVYIADGSLVNLDAETEIITNYSESSRRIELVRGRASFSVAHDAERPFVISAGQIFVRAIGTKFDVHIRNKGKISVSVTEGLVQIESKEDYPPLNFEHEPPGMEVEPFQDPKQDISAYTEQTPSMKGVIREGQKIVVDALAVAYEIMSVDINRVSSWKTGRMHYEMAPLSDVIEEINRYLEHKIIIEDDRLSDMLITVNFSIQHRKDFLPALQRLIPIDVRKSTAGRVSIRKRE
jgi:transmembrane sensor